MSHSIDRRSDGSIALFIDGDLQFDSRDEHIYHECLVAPALHLASARLQGPLSVLILGGGDGLAAREVLKNPLVETIELVDLDGKIVELCRSDSALAALNGGSLSHPRLSATIGSAWDFAVFAQKRYHVIISDLTVPQAQAQTRMHSVEWYALLARLLAEGGAVAVNAASICQTPRAYWSIINSMRKSGLYARPYRIALPSFRDRGYGPDWGFALASVDSIHQEELKDLQLMGSRAWERLFMLPQAAADFRLTAPPVMARSNDLLDSLRSPMAICDPWKADWNSFTAYFDSEPLPEPMAQQSLLPQTIKDLLLSDETVVFEQLLDMMPALGNHQTSETLAELLSAPSQILSTIDLPALVDSLLARAAELPRKAIEELVYLKEALTSINFAEIDLARLGARVASIIALVVIIGNLISPDVAYAKGTAGAAGGHAAAASFHSSSFHSSSLFHTSSFHGGPTAANRFSSTHAGILSGHHAFTGLHPCRPGNGFTQLGLGQRFAINVNGNMYPCKPFRIYSNHFYFNTWQTSLQQSVPRLIVKAPEQIPLYVLGGYSYILPDGTVAILIDDHHSLILGSMCNTIIEIKSGEPLIRLCPSPQENQKVVAQIDDQLALLDQQRQRAQDRVDWANSIGIASITPQDQIELANIVMVQNLLQRSKSLLAAPAPSTVATSAGVAVSEQPAVLNAETTAAPVAKAETPVDTAAAPKTNVETPAADASDATKSGAVSTNKEASAVTAEDAASAKDAVASVKAELQKVDGVEEMFPGVSVDQAGRYALIHLPDGSPAYITGKGWYSDAELTQARSEPAPEKFQKFLVAYTKNQERAGSSATTMEEEQNQAASSHLENLLSEKANYQTVEAQAAITNSEDGAAVKVHYGTLEIPVKEALTRIAGDIASAEQQIVQLNQQTHQNMTHINMLRSLHETLKHRG
jgi:spermidine synthase